MKAKEKVEIEYISIVFVIVFAVYLIYGMPNPFDYIAIPSFDELDSPIGSQAEQVGLATIFVYEFIPEGFRFIGISGIYFALIDLEVNHITLLIVPAIGKIIGELILFVVGIFLFKKFKSKNKLVVSAGKVIHKHPFFAFFLVPFGGMLGAFIMIVAGHEKINFLRVLPILIIANILDVALRLYPTIAQMSLF